MALVVDANLLVALSSGEPEGALVEERLSDWAAAREELHAPALIRYEVASALRRAAVDGRIEPEDIRRALMTAWAVPVALQPPDDLTRALEIAAVLGRRRVNDAVYLALAERLGTRLVTRDGALERNARARGFAVSLM